jgi:anti-sigma factor RsiW
MNRRDGTIIEGDLHAYVDGALDEAHRTAVEAYLAEHPETVAEVEAWQRQNETLRALYGPAGEQPVPLRLGAYRIDRERQIAAGRRWRMAAAAVVLLAAGGFGGWYGRDLLAPGQGPSMPLVDEAIAAHSLYAREVVHPVEVKADQKVHLAAWLSKRLDRPLNIPDLRKQGFDLVGGRLLPAAEGPAAQFMYEDKTGRRVTLYVVPASHQRESAFRYVRLDKLESFFWTDEAISCALVGDLSREALRELAVDAYKQLG